MTGRRSAGERPGGTSPGGARSAAGPPAATEGSVGGDSPGGRGAHGTPLSLLVEPIGPGPGVTDDIASRVTGFAAVREVLKRTKHRVLAVDLVDVVAERKHAFLLPPAQYRATIYDYTNQRALYVDGALRQPEQVAITESAVQPVPSPEEFRAAARLLLEHPELGPLVEGERVQVYRPLPPVLVRVLATGRSERLVTVGLLPLHGDATHEIVGVDLAHRSVIRFERAAPAGAAAHGRACGHDNAAQATVRSAPGTIRLRLQRGKRTIWQLHVVRPAASSGTNGSGVELRYVEYRGKRVLYRAHVPVVSVSHDSDECGPYRAWLNEEGMLHASGDDAAPGFRVCAEPPRSVVATGADAGNWLGVAISVQGLEVVIACELEVGWYRYVSEWRLHVDGTIRPRFGCTAVRSSCACARQFHHVYWRFDFDVRTAGGNRVREFNEPSLFGGPNWHTHHYEIQRPREADRARRWVVENVRTGAGYEIVPGAHDGNAIATPDWPFGQGDVWLLRYHPTEIDDGVIAVGPPHEAPLHAWLNGEAIYDHDIVVWYAAHVERGGGDRRVGADGAGAMVGPTLRPVKW